MSDKLRTIQTRSLPTTPPVKPGEIPKIRIDPTGGKHARNDHASVLDDLARQAKQQNAESKKKSGLRTDGRMIVLQGVSTTFGGMETPTTRRLKEARKNIELGNFPAAIKLLQEVLAEQPAHAEAHLMTAECEFGVNQHELALQRLHRLRSAGVQPEMTTRIQDLAVKISDGLWPSVYESCQEQALAGNSSSALRRVETLVELCPAAAMWHYLLALLQMMAGDVEAAVRSIATAIPCGRPHEMAGLMRLKDDIAQRLAINRMAQAVELFKSAKYRSAREFLASLEVDVQQTKLCRLFVGFLKACEAGRPHQPAADSLAEAEPLYEFIVATEVRAARGATTPVESEQALQPAVAWLPQYPYIQFLYARSLYDHLMFDVLEGSPPPLDVLLQRLRAAAAHAEKAMADPEIKSAPDLLDALNSLIAHFEEIAEQVAKQQREASIVNPVLEEFFKLMESAQRSIGSVDDLRKARKSLQSIQLKIGPARRQVESQAAVEILQQLDDVIQSNLTQLKDLEGEIQEDELVGALIQPFNKLMKGLEAQGKKTSRDDFEGAERELRSIKSKVTGVRQKLTREEPKKRLDELEKVLQQHLDMFRELLEEPPDVQVVNALTSRFIEIMEPFSKNSYRKPTQSEFFTAVMKLKTLRGDCQKARTHASPKGKVMLDELIGAINNNLPSSF